MSEATSSAPQAPLATTFTPTAQLVPVNFAGLAEKIRSTYVSLGFNSEGQEFAVRMRRLTDAEIDEAARHVQGVFPPVKNAEAEGMEKFDWENEEFLKLNKEAQLKQLAELIDKGVEGGIPGDNIDAKVTALRAALPHNVIQLVATKLLEISARNVIGMAGFFSPAA